MEAVRDRVRAVGAFVRDVHDIATETAVPVLSQNWVPLELFVKDASERGSFDYLAVTDHDHVVKAATSPDIVGKPFSEALLYRVANAYEQATDWTQRHPSSLEQ